MKTTFITKMTAGIFLGFATIFSVQAQWTTIPSTSNIYNTAGGNVVIGGTSVLGTYGTNRAMEIQSSGACFFNLSSGVGTGTTNFLTMDCSPSFGNQIVTGNYPFTFRLNGAEQFRITPTGSIGIGAAAPVNKLDIAGGAVIGSTYAGTNTAPTDGLLIQGNLGVGLTSIPSGGPTGGYKMAVSGNTNFIGGVVIGTTANFTASTPFPTPYKLFVEGGILTEKLKISLKTTSDWSDYVFDKNYKLRSLSEVETYVTKYKHLPGVPSAEEVVSNGIDVAVMDAKLLEKIEELTLYMIELKKENTEIKKENKDLSAKNNSFEERLKNLEALKKQ